MARRPRTSVPDSDPRRVSQRTTPGLLEARPLAVDDRPLPQVHARASVFRPFLYKKMVDRVEGNPHPGDLVGVHDREGQLAGHGLYNPRSEIPVRMLDFGPIPPGESFWQTRLEQAVALRRDVLRLDEVTDACRMVHAEGDGLTGLVVDRFGDVLSAEVFSLGIYQRIDPLLARLGALCGTTHTRVRVDDQVHGQEGFLADERDSPECPAQVTVNEFGTKFKVRFASGHKTGFFCDQRDNRKRLAEFCKDKSVLDLCCYTGGFSVQAARLGQAANVTGVDLDEDALEVARENARLNKAQVRFVHADAFTYMRDLARNAAQFDVVVLDPPKLIRSRKEQEVGAKKYFDMNRLALPLVKPGGILLSCSCSGLMPEAEFVSTIASAARQCGPVGPEDASGRVRRGSRPVQFLARSGAAADHPVASNCPESEYLKAVWMRVG